MIMLRYLFIGVALLAGPVFAAEGKDEIVVHDALMDHGDGHLMDMDGAMVMGQNKDKLPGGCDKISEDKQITVRAGRKYAQKGTMFGFDASEWRVKPCTRLTINFVNEDRVRHQWMMHGLPKYMYAKGMFHLEVTGPAQVSGTLILPPEDRTYLVHCDIAQHMEKGMKGQLKVGKGAGDLPVPGTVLAEVAAKLDAETAAAKKAAKDAQQAAEQKSGWWSGMTLVGFLLGIFGAPYLWSMILQRCKEMTVANVLSATASVLWELLNRLIDLGFVLVNRIRALLRK
jgi:plastocyanin